MMMIAAFNHFSGFIVTYLIEISIHIVPFSIAVFLISKWISKRDPRMAYGIWWLVILKLLLPFEPIALHRQIPLQIAKANILIGETLHSSELLISENTTELLTIKSIVFIGYLFVLCMMLYSYFWKKVSLKRLKIEKAQGQEAIDIIFNSIRNKLNLPKNIKVFRIRESFACTTGFFKPCILLPENIVAKSETEIKAILLHEAMHIKNRDPLLFDFLQLLKMVFWFNPILRKIVDEMCFLQELVCDQKVLSTKLLDKKNYGMAIINFNQSAPGSIPNPGFAKSSKSLFRRIRQLNKGNEMKTSIKLITVFGIVLLSLTTFDLSAGSTYERFICPMKYGRVSSPFGMRMHPFKQLKLLHKGIDVVAAKGTPVHAAKSGVVIFAASKKGYGNTVIIQHEKTKTVYAQLSEILVKKGETITQDNIIGKVGSSGISTGPHLHFEIRENNIPVNPEKHIDFSSI